MKTSKKYPTVKVRPIQIPQKKERIDDICVKRQENEKNFKEELKEISTKQTESLAEIEPEAEIMEEKRPKSQMLPVILETENKEISTEIEEMQEKLPEIAAKQTKKRKKRIKNVVKPAIPQSAVLPITRKNTKRTDFTAVSEDFKAEKDQKSLFFTQNEDTNPENESVSHIENHENASISHPKITLLRRIFQFVYMSKPCEKTVCLRKVYFILLIQITFTCIWTGIVIFSSDLQDIMRENYWLICLFAFVLMDVLWVKMRFRGVFRKVRYGVVLGVVLVGGM